MLLCRWPVGVQLPSINIELGFLKLTLYSPRVAAFHRNVLACMYRSQMWLQAVLLNHATRWIVGGDEIFGKGTDDIRIVDRAESWQGPVQVRVS